MKLAYFEQYSLRIDATTPARKTEKVVKFDDEEPSSN